MADDPIYEVMGRWVKMMEARVQEVENELADVQGRLSFLEGEPIPPPTPSPSELPLIPFTEPPLLYNKGSWDSTDIFTEVIRPSAGERYITIGQKEQLKDRVVRCDYGFQNPGLEPGRGGFLREPAGKWRRYELEVTLPDPYDNRAEMTNLMQIHTDSTTDPPHLAFLLWTKNVYWRRNGLDGERVDYDMGPIRPGHTYKLRIDAKWSQDEDGELKAWMDGQICLHKKGPNYPKGQRPGYFVFGPYSPSAKKAFRNTFKFSGLRVGDI